MPRIRFGVDTLLHSHLSDLHGLRVGLVTNDVATTAVRHETAAALLPPLTPTRLALQQAGVGLTKLFAPEHGLAASAADGAEISDAVDALTRLPILSLYGATFRPTPAMLRDLDLLLFDIPDIGARFYTYIWTLSHITEACAEIGLPLWVLDRPNPVGGDLRHAEGPMLDEANLSTFVGRWSMPIRHCLTVGELATLWNHERGLGVDLRVIPVQGWQRHDHWPALEVPFIPLSPSMPSYEAGLLYPGTCLFEGTNLSEGRGTSTPFQHIGAPWLDGIALAAALNAQELPGVVARPVHFIPALSKYAGDLCRGVMLHVTDAKALRPVAVGLHLLALITQHHVDQFAWLPYPTAANAPGYGHFDRLIGRLDLREQLMATCGNLTAQIAAWTNTDDWSDRVKPYLLYSTG